MQDRLLIVSADGHVGARPETYRDYIDPAHRGAIDDLVAESAEWNRLTRTSWSSDAPSEHELLAEDDDFAGWNLTSRLAALDDEGVAAEVVHFGVQGAALPFFSAANKPCSPELQDAGTEAYNRWIADWAADSNGRILPVAATTSFDLEASVARLQWAAERGFVAAALPQGTHDPALPPLHDPYYEPLWAASEELGLALSMHAGWGTTQGRFWEFAAGFLRQGLGVDVNAFAESGASETALLLKDALATSKDSPLILGVAPRRALWQMMVSGVFDRHPSLTLVITELRADWVPATLAELDEHCRRSAPPMELLPSEYWARNCYVTPSSVHECEAEMRHEIGLDRILFGTDCPHPEGTYPDTMEWLRRTFADTPADEFRAVVAENAIRCYHLDRSQLDPIAAAIGPTMDELFDGSGVDDELVQSFDQRAGYLRPPEQIDTEVLERLFAEDLGVLAARPGVSFGIPGGRTCS